MKLYQYVNPYKITLSSKLGYARLKHRLLGQIIEKTCVHCRGQSCDPKFMKFRENVNPRNV